MSRAPLQVGRRAWIIGAAAGGVLVVGYLSAALATAGAVAEGTTVSGLDVGGQGAQQARRALVSAERSLGGSLAVAAGDSAQQVSLTTVGLRLDPDATVGQFTGFTLSPQRLWQRIAGGGGEYETLPRAAGAGLQAGLRPLAASVATPAVEAGVVFDGATPQLLSGKPGSQLSPDAAGVVRRGWLTPVSPLRLPTAAVAQKVTRDQAATALAELAEPAVSGPLSLVVGSRTVTLQPAAFGAALSVEPDAEGELRLQVDGGALRDAVLKAEPAIGKSPKDASFTIKGGKPVLTPAVEGVTIDPKSLASAVVPALAGSDDKARTARIATAVKEPDLTTAEAQKLGIRERVSTFSTILTDNPGRTENLRIAARTVNGTLVLPGESFSLNEVLGRRTPEKGYNRAPAINGGRLVNDYGGGVSQMATTIFNNVFFAGLEDIYHKPHSFYISRYPEGREATVNYPTVDLKWRNDSPYGVLIKAEVTSTVNVSFYSTKVWEVTASKGGRSNARTPKTVYDPKPGCVAQAPNSGFDVSVTRTMRRIGKPSDVRRQTWNTTYIAEDRVICAEKPKKSAD